MKNEIGKIVIDELKICYEAEAQIIDDLKKIELGEMHRFNDVVMARNYSHHFQYAFDVLVGDVGNWDKIATAKFGRYGEAEESNYFFYRLENSVLYSPDKMAFALRVPEALGMVFHNFTSLDLALDARTDLAMLIKRMMRREDIITIINSKAVNSRKKVIQGVTVTYETTLERLKNISVTVKQKKALHDKTKGVTVQAYNKMQEIENSSHKTYISDFYGNPKRLYRLEVRLNNEELKDYFKRENIVADIDMLSDGEMLQSLFFYHLSSVIRFTKGRKKLDWVEVIKCNGKL